MAIWSSTKERENQAEERESKAEERERKMEEREGGEEHPYDFRVCGPRNLSSPTWKDIFSSSWKDPNYKRGAMACFIQGVYLLELDRQQATLLPPAAPQWWRHFNYKLSQLLTDPRDGSIYAAVFLFDRAAALCPLKPAAAPRAVLALRGTLLGAATARNDLADDLRFLAWESLKGSARFAAALAAAADLAKQHGGAAVCLAGHSLGAAFALQLGKALAQKGVYVDCHLFNPPAISIAAGVKTIGDKARAAWRRLRSGGEEASPPSPAKETRWAPHLYVNNGDYLCSYYCGEESADGEGATAESTAAKVFVAVAKTPQRFVEAHGLQQWWSEDVVLRHVPGHSNELIRRQLKSLYS